MKKIKIKKRMVSFLMLAIMVVSIIGVMPKTIAYADDTEELPDYDFKQGNPYSDVYFNLFKWDSSLNGCTAVSFWNADSKSVCIARISTNSNINARYTEYCYIGKHGGGSQLDETNENALSHSGKFTYNGTTYYYAYYEMTGTGPYQIKSGPVYKTEESLYKKSDQYICDYIADRLPTSCTIIGDDGADTDKVPDGSQDNPMEDKDIGTIVLKSHGFISTKNDNFIGDVSASYDYYFKYKDKTSSGFSISDNKYARTFIQIRVQNQCVLFEKDNENSIKEYYPHYGEFYNYKNLATENVSNNTVKVSWGEVMSKWSDYTEHPLATNKKLAYRFMLRVICTDSLTVVPDESSGWYAGGWRSFIFDGDKFLEETNGHVDGDGNWSDDEDDGYNDSSDKTSHNNENKDDVDDLLNDDSSSSGSSGKLNISNIKAFMKEVGNVPKAIGKLFSFLPTWVTTFIGFGFVVLVALIIIKVIRG